MTTFEFGINTIPDWWASLSDEEKFQVWRNEMRLQECECGHHYNSHHWGFAYGLATHHCSECKCPEFSAAWRMKQCNSPC